MVQWGGGEKIQGGQLPYPVPLLSAPMGLELGLKLGLELAEICFRSNAHSQVTSHLFAQSQRTKFNAISSTTTCLIGQVY